MIVFNRDSYFNDLTWNISLLFFLICVSFLWALLGFCALEFVRFLLLSKDPIFQLSCFFQTSSDSNGPRYLALNLVGMHSATSMSAVTKFSYSYFRISVSDVSWRLSYFSYSNRIFIANISVSMGVRVFANGSEDLSSIPGRIIPKT